VFQLRLLGPFESARDGRPLDIGSVKQRAILALLALRPNQVVSRDSLIEELWGESAPPSAIGTLHSLVSRLRRVLTDARVDEDGVVLRARGSGYVLECDPDRVDAHRFEALVGGARDRLAAGDAEESIAGLRAALALWRGRPLSDLGDVVFATVEAERLEEMHRSAVEDLAEAELRCARPQEAVALLEPHVAGHPFRERACGQLMLALYRLGRQAEALSVFRRVRATIVDELGVEPTPALRALEEQILHQSPDLEWSAPAHRVPVAAVAEAGRGHNTLAFLFTDIESSTRRWEGDRKAMAQDLARHDTLLRAVVEQAGGEVFCHAGDGLCAAFADSAAALSAAVGGQRALRAERWVAGDLRVRMAVHAGAAERRSGTFVGPTLNRVARLLAVAHGGQVLCSGAAADLVRDELPGGVNLLDLGEHGLADLGRPEHIFQVDSSGLPSTFPPLRTSSARHHNMTWALTPFIGRVAELGELTRLLTSARLLTLTGVGGVGKTRLALEAAASVLGEFPDGVWIVELGPVPDPGLVVTEAAAALGVPMDGLAAGSERAVEQICEHLRDRRLLIVIDNCEHLIDASARLVHAVLAHCPQVGVLATSRELLGLSGEVAHRVPPMSLPPSDPASVELLRGSDAVTLFCERARAAQPAFSLSGANAAAVAQICHRLDGIPLALELAAARIRVLSAHQIAERLDQAFRLLTGGARTAVPRHQTLRATMDWSYAALPTPEQTLLRRLSVFRASFELEAAEAIMRDGDEDRAEPPSAPGFEVLDLLSRLVDKSLVTVQAEGPHVRYRLLETVRQYAAERLVERGEAVEAHRRHRDHFLRTARSWGVGSQHDHEPLLQRVMDNEDDYRAALTWSAAVGDEEEALGLAAIVWSHYIWAVRPEGVAILERVLAGPRRPPTPERVEVLVGLAVLLHEFGDPDPQRAEHLLHAALEQADRLGDLEGKARAVYFLAELALIHGNVRRAEEWLARASSECSGSRIFARGWFHFGSANAAVVAGDLPRAKAHLEQGLVQARHNEVGLLVPQGVAALAPLAALTGERERAMALAEEAMRSAAAFRWRRGKAAVLLRASEAMLLAAHSSRAREVIRQLLELLVDARGRGFVADALETAAVLLTETGSAAAAVRLLGTSEVIRETDGQPVGGTRTLTACVHACADRIRASLPACEYERELIRGRETTLGEGIAYALAQLRCSGT
jgi:predicted ATPase/DNA-binding SARP family transcriptional activator